MEEENDEYEHSIITFSFSLTSDPFLTFQL